MSDIALAVSVVPSSVDSSMPVAVRAGETVGRVVVLACKDQRVELKTPSELGWGRAMIGLVPILWCAAAWTMCLQEHLLSQRLGGCVALTIMAVVSAALMNSSLGAIWRFDGKRRRISRRFGLVGRSHNARRLAGLRVESTRVTANSDVHLRMTLVDGTGKEQFEIATWKRREIDRAQVDALAGAIRKTMSWTIEA